MQDGIYMGPNNAENQVIQAKDKNQEDSYPCHVLLVLGEGENEGGTTHLLDSTSKNHILVIENFV